jgi:hypothetical protein
VIDWLSQVKVIASRHTQSKNGQDRLVRRSLLAATGRGRAIFSFAFRSCGKLIYPHWRLPITYLLIRERVPVGPLSLFIFAVPGCGQL